jgi:hypothetical protein
MVQAVIAYVLVAVAACWVIWSIFVPGKLKARLRGRVKRVRPR